MKKYQMAGFDAIISDDKTVTTISGEPILAGAKSGKFGLTATETAGDYVEGKKYGFDADQLFADENFAATSEASASEAPATSEADAAKEAHKEKTKQLKSAVKAATDKLFSGTAEDFIANKEALQVATDAYNAHIGTKVEKPAREFTADEKAVIADYENALADYEAAKEAAKEAKEVTAKYVKFGTEAKEGEVILPDGYKAGKVGPTTDVAARGERVGYEVAQQVREAVSKGEKPGDIAKKFGISTSGVHHYANYLQHKLKAGDTAFTPLVNEYYPNGAPLAGTDYKEHSQKYVPAAKRTSAE